MPENSRSLRETGDIKQRESFFLSADTAWKAGFILLLVAAGWLYLRRAMETYLSAPIPAGDAMEEFLQAERFFLGNPPGENIWLNRWPALSLVLCLFWHLTGKTALVHYLLGGAALLATAAAAGILAWKRCGRPFAMACLVLLTFQPVIIQNSARGLTEPLFSLLLVLLLVCGRLLPKRPLLYLLPTAVIAALLVLCKEEGRLLSGYFLIIFSIYYIKTRQVSVKLLIAMFCCAAAALSALYGYAHYVESHSLIPPAYRIGGYLFYKEFLVGKTAFDDINRFFTMMTPLEWLKLHPPGEWAAIFFRGVSNAYGTFNSMLFPGAALLVIAGLIRSAFERKLDFFFILPIAAFYLAPFAFHIDNRYLLPFYCLSLVPALQGLKQIAASLSFIRNPDFRNRLAGAVPAAFCILALFFGHLIRGEETVVKAEADHLPDQTALQTALYPMLLEGRFEEAGDSLKVGLSRNPDWAFFHLARGVTLYAAGEKSPAFEHLDRSIRLNPYQMEAYHVAYYLLLREGRRAKALNYLERSLKYRPEAPLTNKLLLQAYNAEGRSDTLDRLKGKTIFNYYLRHPVLRTKAQLSSYTWYKLLSQHLPLEGEIVPGPAGPQTFRK